MSDYINNIIIRASLLLFLSIIASKAFTTLGIPNLLLFLLIGILFSGNYLGLIPVPDVRTVKSLGIISLTLVLFLGGLETEFAHVKPIWKSGFLLSTVATLAATAMVGFFLNWLTKGYLDLKESFLIGAIVASTDAAAVFSILRSSHITLKNNLAPLLEIESGTNDVMAAFLMFFLLDFIEFLVENVCFLRLHVQGTACYLVAGSIHAEK